MSSSPFLDSYEPLDVIGNGSFGIIRKVRRKSDGIVFARKELNFERMSERDRKQIVAEVNILKDLHHEHIVRYHDRYVDRDAGILYILMEYCGGGDLSTVIKQASRQNRVIPEDTIWNYFYQILQALHHCHHPNNHQRSGSGSASPPVDCEGTSCRRAQILHRDLKPDNVFLDTNHTVKLGDFGLSKALAQASFANTYVGTPYYMSPELMQEKAYDSKSDIWSLGCLIYELCALKPPFHEAKTHSELSIFIRNGRIPPLPRGYSQVLTSVIKSMLNLNPAMRPSAAQLLQHERIDTIHKVAEATRMFEIVKSHRAAVAIREREVTAREQSLQETEQRLVALITQKDHEIATLQQAMEDNKTARRFSAHDVELAVRQAVMRRENELRVLVTEREGEVAASMNKREEEIMEAVQRREAEICEAWVRREGEIRKEYEENYKAMQQRMDWVAKRESELKEEESRLEEMRERLESKKVEEETAKGRKVKPLEEVKNLVQPNSRLIDATPVQRRRKPDTQPAFKPPPTPIQTTALETPIARPTDTGYLPSAMKGVVLTATGETLSTPAPMELSKLFDSSPKVGLNFAKIFDFDEGDKRVVLQDQRRAEVAHSPPPSPSSRKEREREKEKEREREREREKEDPGSSGPSTSTTTIATPIQPASAPTVTTRIRRPSMRRSRSITLPDPAGSTTCAQLQPPQAKPLPHPHLLRPSTSASNLASLPRLAVVPAPTTTTTTTKTVHVPPSPEYDFTDEENLPSPFLKRVDNNNNSSSSSSVVRPGSTIGGVGSSSAQGGKHKRTSGLLLRAVAAANSAGRRAAAAATTTALQTSGADHWSGGAGSALARPSLASARKASEEARKALSRP